MAKLVVHGAVLACSKGSSLSNLAVVPSDDVWGDSAAAGTVRDSKPNTNIQSFGMCNALSNPQVAAATAAAQGVLTPQPCVPMTAAPWTPGSASVTIGESEALSDACQLLCQWGGQIQIQSAGQNDIDVD